MLCKTKLPVAGRQLLVLSYLFRRTTSFGHLQLKSKRNQRQCLRAGHDTTSVPIVASTRRTTIRCAAASTVATSAGSGSQTVSNYWLITINSFQGFELTDDDGRRLMLELLDGDGKHITTVNTDVGKESWGRPRSLPTGWMRRGLMKVPKAGTVPAAVKVIKQASDDGQVAVDYISEVTVADSKSGHVHVRFPVESWIASKAPDNSHEKRIFFAQTAVPGKMASGLLKIRNEELATIKGAGTGSLLTSQRTSEAERIYDYQVYNDLGKPKEPRPTLGGSTWPYPRRLATHKGSSTGVEDRNGKAPWLPLDEKFQFVKNLNFQAGKISSAVPAALEGLNHILDVIKEGKFSAANQSRINTLALLGAIVSAAGLAALLHILVWPQLHADPSSTLYQLGQAAVVGVTVPLVYFVLRRIIGVTSPGALDYEDFEDVLMHYSLDVLPPPLAPTYGPTSASVAPAAAPEADSSSVKPDRTWMSDKVTEIGNDFMDEKTSSVAESMAAAAAARIAPSSTQVPGAKSSTPNSALIAADNNRQVAKRLLKAAAKLKKPRVLQDRQVDATQHPITLADEEFGRQMLAGFNPVVISALKKLPAELGSAISDSDVAADLGGQGLLEQYVQEAAAGSKPRLYWVDYWGPFAQFFVEEWKARDAALHAGRALLYLLQDDEGNDIALVPIAIELAAHPSCYSVGTRAESVPTSGVVYSRSKLGQEGAAIWDLAKLVFRSVDVAVHQLVSHWLRTHATMEPFLIALRRNLSPMHPVFKLMLPHFRYTLAINASARSDLISAGGVIEKTFAAGEYAMRISSLLYKKWRFVNEALPTDLKNRGMVDSNNEPWIADYPYAVDGMHIWAALQNYFKSYLDLYYDADEDVLQDEELQNWWREVREEGHPDLVKEGFCTATECWGKGRETQLSTKEGVVEVLATIAWIGSALHATVNFAQYDFTSFPLNAPSLIRKPIPTSRDDPAWQALVKERQSGRDRGQLFMQYINDPISNLLVALTVTLLSSHSDDEQTLDMPNTLLTDDKAIALNKKFIADLKQLESKIDLAHRKNGWVRAYPSPNNGTAYEATYATTLVPGSVPGLTMRGVPYSVSI